ncbi:MAG: substrate-binding domain-containing protein [Chitinophagales bacterium]|nr:substrate-binding domain-containing protein [Chitinophagales bacterium]MDW8428398.1 substrate-binding domain-containing protein [Chitinophagales bacterium]
MQAGALWLFVLVVWASCTSGKKKQEPSLIAGKLTVACDATLRPLMDDLIQIYEARYPEADITAIYADEEQVSRLLLADSAQLALLSRQLTDAETLPVREKGEVVRQLLFAGDGIAFIVNRKRTDTVYTVEQLYQLLEGKAPGGQTGPIIVPGMRSALYRSLQQLLPQGRTLSPRVFAVADEEAVVSYIEQNVEAVGVISSSWISKRGDTISEAILQRVRVLAVQDTSGRICLPARPHLLSRCYPFLREIYLIIREKGVSVGMGFGTFLMAQDGQLAVHRFGLLAVKQPVRVIEVKKEF